MRKTNFILVVVALGLASIVALSISYRAAHAQDLHTKSYRVTLYSGGSNIGDWHCHDVSFAGPQVFFRDSDRDKQMILNGTWIVEEE